MENKKSQGVNDALYIQVSEDVVGSAECYQHALLRKLAGGGNQYDAAQTSFEFNKKEGN